MPETDKILSQHEVDALLSAIDSGGGESSAESAAEPYDFRRPSRIPPGPLRFIHAMHEGFAREVQSALSGMLLRPVEARLAGVHQLPLGEFVSSQPHPAVLMLLSAAPLEGSFLLSINPAIAYPLLERLLGAGKVAAPQRDRALSPLEWNVTDALAARLLDLLAAAWAPVAPLHFEIIRRESDPQALKFDSPNEPSVAVALEIALGDQRGGLEIGFPSLAVEPYLAKMVSSAPFSALKDAGQGREESISRRLAPAEVEVGAHLPPETLRIQDLEGLRPGDLLVTNHPHTGPVFVTVEGRRKFLARLGSLKERKAVKIVVQAAEPFDPVAGRPFDSAQGKASRPALTVLKSGEGAGAVPPKSGAAEAVMQLPLTASVVLAEKTLRLREVLALRPGEVLEFPRRADDPLELRVAGRAIAEGAAVKIGERFGLRISGMKGGRDGAGSLAP
jgi:flagellar motor switch protein FliM